jgi:hypothetical protein
MRSAPPLVPTGSGDPLVAGHESNETAVVSRDRVLMVLNYGSEDPENAIDGRPGAMAVKLKDGDVAVVEPREDGDYNLLNTTHVGSAYTD